MSIADTHEPDPVKRMFPCITDLVIKDMQERQEFGIRKYGTCLQPFNGRRPMVDAYQELLDLAVYFRQAIYELYGE